MDPENEDPYELYRILIALGIMTSAFGIFARISNLEAVFNKKRKHTQSRPYDHNIENATDLLRAASAPPPRPVNYPRTKHNDGSLINLESGDILGLDEFFLQQTMKKSQSEYFFQNGRVIPADSIDPDMPACSLLLNPTEMDALKTEQQEQLYLTVFDAEDLADRVPGFKGVRIHFSPRGTVFSIDCMLSKKSKASEKYKELTISDLLKSFGGKHSSFLAKDQAQ